MEQSESPTRELTLEEAVSFAILLQKNKQSSRPHELYRRVLETAPDHPRALHYAGVLAHQQGRSDEAIALIERSLALVPDQADWYSNLGIVFQSADRLDAAIDAVPACDRHRSEPRERPQQSRACCCGRPDSRSKRKPRIAQPFDWILNTSTRTPTWAFCSTG